MSTTKGRQLTPDETIEAVTRVAAHVPVQVVADELGVSPEAVLSVVTRAKANRAARGLTPAPQAEATPRVRNGLDTDVPPTPAPNPPPQDSEPAEPDSVLVGQIDTDSADLFTYEELAEWGREIGINRAVILAERVTSSAEELRAMARRREEIQMRQSVIVVLERQLATARGELVDFTGNQRPARRAGTNTSEIRAWAIANGHDVQARGLLPNTVIHAYRAAHTPAGAS